MESKESPSPEPEFSYFSMQASWGVTKHMGGPEATDEMATLCQVDQNKHVLEVGCGTGITACRLASRFGCQVVGVDLSDKMVEWANKRATRKGLTHKVQFKVADAQSLPFEDGLFDVVICESVLAFPPDKQKVVDEYTRVTKPGGWVGLNECTWVKPSPPADLVEYSAHTMAGARFLTPDGWKALLETAGLTEITARSYTISAFSQRLDEMKGLDAQDRLDRLRGIKDFLRLFLTSPGFRKYAKEITPSMSIIKNLFAYLGYGLYTGKK